MPLRITAVHLFLDCELLGDFIAVEFSLRPGRSKPRRELLLVFEASILEFSVVCLNLAHINDNVIHKTVRLSRHECALLLLAAVDHLDVVALYLVRER